MFDQLVDGVSAALWNLDPSEAVYLGKHEYDGVVPELTEDAIGTQLERLRLLKDRLQGLEGLDADQRFDRSQLIAAVDSALITWDRIEAWRRNPIIRWRQDTHV